MTPLDWFTLVLRAFGVWELINACEDIVTVLNIHAGIYKPMSTGIGTYITHGMLRFLIGIWLLKAAPTFARLFYPVKPVDPGSNEAPPGQ